MRYIIWTIAIFTLLILQGGIFLSFNMELISLPLLIVIISLLFSDFDFALFLAFISGLMLDFLSGSSGVVLTAFVCTFLIMYFVINNVLDREPNLMILFSAVAAGTAAYFSVYLGVNQVLGIFQGTVPVNYKIFFLQDLPKALILNLIFTYPIFQFYTFVEYINQRFTKYGAKSI